MDSALDDDTASAQSRQTTGSWTSADASAHKNTSTAHTSATNTPDKTTDYLLHAICSDSATSRNPGVGLWTGGENAPGGATDQTAASSSDEPLTNGGDLAVACASITTLEYSTTSATASKCISAYLSVTAATDWTTRFDYGLDLTACTAVASAIAASCRTTDTDLDSSQYADYTATAVAWANKFNDSDLPTGASVAWVSSNDISAAYAANYTADGSGNAATTDQDSVSSDANNIPISSTDDTSTSAWAAAAFSNNLLAAMTFTADSP